MTNPTTQTQSEDLFSVDQLDVKCHLCGEQYLERDTKSATVTDDGTYSVYTFVCNSATCNGKAVLKVPRCEEAQRGVPSELQIEESELHPDDGFSIAKLDCPPDLRRIVSGPGKQGRGRRAGVTRSTRSHRIPRAGQRFE